MQRSEWGLIYNDEVAPAAHTYAEGIHEEMSKAMVEGMAEALADVADEVDEKFANTVMLPAMKAQVFARLATLCEQATTGWHVVYAQGLRDYYE